MFGSDVVLRSIEDFERCGLAPYLGRVGLDHRSRALAPLRFELTAVAARTARTAERVSNEHRSRVPGSHLVPYHGEKPWEEIFARHEIDILFVATPDPLHREPVLCALRHGAHVMVEKPLTLRLEEADDILDLARKQNLVVGVDMHKRYDPFHRFLFRELVPRIGKPLYARAVLEEPLEVSTETFKWAASSNPFSYVGVHWADLFGHSLGLEPASVHAVGQKELLARWHLEGGEAPIDTFDSMQVAVDYSSGLRVDYVNAWIAPREFEGHVNQEMEITGTRGKIELDQQDRGLRAAIAGVGSRTYNPLFTADVPRICPGAPGMASGGSAAAADAPPSTYDGYGKDSITAIVERAVEVHLGLATRDELRGTYPDVESARSTVGILEAAAEVAARNLACLRAGKGTPVTARFSQEGIEVVDPSGKNSWLYRGNPHSR